MLNLCILALNAVVIYADQPSQLGRGAYLFIDDHWIDSVENVTRSLNQPVRDPKNPILRSDQPWEDGMVVLQPGTVIYDEQAKVFKMWYEAPTNQRERNPSSYLCYATSRDGVQWEKPKLGLVEFHGSTANNIVMAAIQHDGNWFTHTVLKERDERDPSRRYKIIFWDQSPQEGEYGFFVAFSPDGIHWTRQSNTPVAPLSRSGDTGNVIWYSDRQEYVFFQKSPIMPIRKIARMTSKDFVHWGGGQVVLEPDHLDPSDTEFYGMSVFPYADRYVGMLWVFHTYLQRMDVQLISSFDTLSWHRAVNRRIFLPLGYQRNEYPGQSFDSEMIFPSSQPILFGDELMIYYSGFNRLHNSFNNQSGIGLARLRRDGFVSLDAAGVPALVVTKPFVLDGTRLAVNISEVTRGSSGPSLRAEVQSLDGVPFPGYELAAADTVVPGIKASLSWKGASDLGNLHGRTIRLKFVLNNVKFYAFQIE